MTESIDEHGSAEVRTTESDASPGVARAGGSAVPPEQLDARDAEGPDGTAAGDPLAGVTISEADADEAVSGDTGPENPGQRGASALDRPV